MSEESSPKHLSLVSPRRSTSSIPIVPVQPPLTPQEIERICKAFIRLITAKETRRNGK